ncbi:MAG: 50S ribosomal protein L25 [Candidatus Paceibacterota bacterium]
MITLEAKQRTGSPAALREQDMIPAVYYGAGKDAVSIAVPAKEFIKVYKEAGENTAVILTIGGEKISTIIHAMQRDPMTGAALHVDFLIIDMKKEIEVAIPIEFTGVAEAEKAGLGTVVKSIHEVEVRALPNDLPHNFEIDITSLATLEDQIHVKDIKLPKGVTMITDGEEVVVSMAHFIEETEEAPVLDLSAIEVEKKGKTEDEE